MEFQNFVCKFYNTNSHLPCSVVVTDVFVRHKRKHERLIIQEEYDFRCMEKSGLSDLSTKLQILGKVVYQVVTEKHLIPLHS